MLFTGAEIFPTNVTGFPLPADLYHPLAKNFLMQ